VADREAVVGEGGQGPGHSGGAEGGGGGHAARAKERFVVLAKAMGPVMWFRPHHGPEGRQTAPQER
jgi:hypothetical protein